MTQIESYPLDILGKLVMKSIDISFHFQASIDSGWTVPTGLDV
jgi:hypothetical protein